MHKNPFIFLFPPSLTPPPPPMVPSLFQNIPQGSADFKWRNSMKNLHLRKLSGFLHLKSIHPPPPVQLLEEFTHIKCRALYTPCRGIFLTFSTEGEGVRRGGSTYGPNRHRPPFWQINHANSAYFRLFLGYFRVISATRPPLLDLGLPFLHILDPPLVRYILSRPT